mmetsp:Transcript_24261/g.37414  ORF Transcript_24261/g.37414 Transcript_24261/m.37414 type:complete len:87 (+) Transcript_24261:3116-3376(+)
MENEKFKKKFKDTKQIGEGGFGKVYKATYKVDQKEYAIKVVRLNIKQVKGVSDMDSIHKNRVYRELAATSNITSENTVRYFHSWFE